MKDIDELEEIIRELEGVLHKHGGFMAVKGANVYFAYQSIRKAIRYLKNELETLKRMYRLC